MNPKVLSESERARMHYILGYCTSCLVRQRKSRAAVQTLLTIGPQNRGCQKRKLMATEEAADSLCADFVECATSNVQ